ncbi:interferon lambda-2-like [Engystomops pustulosus]|uniref:interferon lambda-2-like n=1 Tax=Engystomops pustulosus TaxID=76066 RepID=UPI003AFB3BA6
MDIRLVVLSIVLVAVSGHPHRRRCPMSRYKSLSTEDITVIRQLQNDHTQNMSSSALRCYRRMIRHKPSVCDLKSSDRLIMTLKRITITTEVLANLSTSAVPDPVSQSLMMLLKIKDDLLICRGSPGQDGGTTSEQLKPWLHHLQHFVEEASPQCLQDAVILGLIPLLVEDVGCWAHGK